MHRWLRQLPNGLSSIRILLLVPIAWSIAQQRFLATLWLFVLAAVSDAADGFLAKRFGWQTRLGGILDPLADKLMIATVFIMLALRGAVPRWLAAAVIARDCVILGGAIGFRIWIGPVEARPSTISKLNTLCQIVFILVIIGDEAFARPPDSAATALGALVFVTVVVSGVDYVLVYARQAVAQTRARMHALRHGGSTPA